MGCTKGLGGIGWERANRRPDALRFPPTLDREVAICSRWIRSERVLGLPLGFEIGSELFVVLGVFVRDREGTELVNGDGVYYLSLWLESGRRSLATPSSQVDGQTMQQCSELLLLPFLGCSTHALQPLGHAWAALCRSHVGRLDVLLGLRPSLQALRGWLPSLVRTFHRYYARVRLLARVPVGLLALAFSHRSAA